MGGLSAATVETDPVGAMAITLPTGSDSAVSVSFHRPPEFQGRIAGITENEDQATITFTSLPAWTANQFVYSAGVQPNHYYMLVASGTQEGEFFTVVSNTANSVTVNLDANTLALTQSDGVHGQGMGDYVAIIPNWSLATLFSSIEVDNVRVFFFSDQLPGINMSASAIYRYDGGQGMWVQGNVDANDTPLKPGQSLVVRNQTGEALNWITAGNVPMTKWAELVGTLASNVAQDNRISLMSPIEISLENSGLGNHNDRLFEFDNDFIGINKSATAIYRYDAEASPAGWYQGNVYVGDSVYLKPNLGYVLRRSAESDPALEFWRGTPPYLD